jgi:hypothetical protein
MNAIARKTLIHTLLIVLSLALLATAEARPSNKWRLQFSGGADSDGTITLLISPLGGEPIRAEIAITDGTGENAVAKAVVAGLREQLPSDGYHVERDDGEDVLVKKRRGAADFEIEVVANTVKGVHINRDRE